MSATIDEVLDILHRTGPDLVGGNSNHGPMAAEALFAWAAPTRCCPGLKGIRTASRTARQTVTLSLLRAGRRPWATEAARRLGRLLRPRAGRSALAGGAAGVGATPGAWARAAATHGLIRTGHAVRSLAASATPQRLHELAEGLGLLGCSLSGAAWQAIGPSMDTRPARRSSTLDESTAPILRPVVRSCSKSKAWMTSRSLPKPWISWTRLATCPGSSQSSPRHARGSIWRTQRA